MLWSQNQLKCFGRRINLNALDAESIEMLWAQNQLKCCGRRINRYAVDAESIEMLWLQNQMKVDDIGNLFKPHKRIKDYLRYGNIPYVLLPSIRDDLDSSNKILKSDHINLVKSDYSGFKQKATKEQILFFEEYSSTS